LTVWLVREGISFEMTFELSPDQGCASVVKRLSRMCKKKENGRNEEEEKKEGRNERKRKEGRNKKRKKERRNQELSLKEGE
jgi:hypothetical protein